MIATRVNAPKTSPSPVRDHPKREHRPEHARGAQYQRAHHRSVPPKRRAGRHLSDDFGEHLGRRPAAQHVHGADVHEDPATDDADDRYPATEQLHLLQ